MNVILFLSRMRNGFTTIVFRVFSASKVLFKRLVEKLLRALRARSSNLPTYKLSTACSGVSRNSLPLNLSFPSRNSQAEAGGERRMEKSYRTVILPSPFPSGQLISTRRTNDSRGGVFHVNSKNAEREKFSSITGG